MSGHRYICFDNVDRMLESEALASFITLTFWDDRELGTNRKISIPNNTVCFANGNNTHVGGNLARRIVPVKLESPGAQPWMRDKNQFAHPRLREWVTENRGRIIGAILTIIRAWVNAGRPGAKDAITLGSFEAYCEIISSILSFMGFKNFLGNLEELYTEIDIDTPAWAEFFRVWHENVTTPVTVKELISFFDNAELKNALPEIVADTDDKGYTRKLGNQLAKREKQKFENGLMLRRAGEYRNRLKWQIVSLEDQTNTKIVSNVSCVSLYTSFRREQSEPLSNPPEVGCQ
jgi:hypothetical protein